MANLAILGCAHIHTPGFITRLQNRNDMTVSHVYDHDFTRAQANAKTLNASVAASPKEIFDNPAITGVIVCSETCRHEELVIPAAAAGKHLFIEKPLGMGTQDSIRMATAIEQAGVIFQTGYFRRGTPIEMFLKKQIDAGAFGKITRVRHTNCHSGSLGGWFDTDWRWMADPAQAGCGAFGDLGTHSLDIILWWLDGLERVTADIDTATGRYGDCDEYGEGLLKFRNGTIASIAAGWVDVAHPVGIIISGTEGHAHVDAGWLYFKSAHVEGADGKDAWEDLPAPLPHAFDLFLDALSGRNVPLVGVREAALRSAVMEAMYTASREKTWIVPTLC